jgi:hypothetical protein
MTYVGPEPFRRQMCTTEDIVKVLAGDLDRALHIIEGEWCGYPTGDPIKDPHPDLLPYVPETVTPACLLATVAMEIADWFVYWAPDVPGVGADGLAAALRRFAGKVIAEDSDPAQLARDVNTLAWQVHRGHCIYEEHEP